jgi:5-methylthioadenosine/S-adenosylhomocysteine deaminase
MGLLIRDGLVVILEGGDIRVQRGTIVVEGDRIARLAFGNAATQVQPGPSDRVIEAKHRLVIPGLVDAHTHFYGTLVPGLIDHLPLDMRMLPLGAVTRGWGDSETRVAALLAALRMMRNGTTTVLENVLQGFETTDVAIRSLVDSGLRAMVGPMIADRPFHETMPGYVERLPEPYRSEALTVPVPSAKDLLESSLSVASRWHGAEGRIYICLSPSTPHRCTDSLLGLIAEAAHTHKLSVHTHLLETRVQVAVARRLYGRTMVEYIWKLGLLKPGFCGAHSVWLTDGDIELLAEARAGVCHNPLSNLYLGSGIARVPELLRRGVAVGIGSDGPNCGSSTSLFEVIKLAAVVHRIREDDGRQWISARDAFRMATIGGAQALGLDHEIGSLEVGKKADIVLLNADAPNFVPLNNPVMQLVYGETGSAVETVVVNGEVVFNAGKPTRFDSAAVLAEAAELGSSLREQAEPGLAEASTLEPYLKEAYLALIREFDASISTSKSHNV